MADQLSTAAISESLILTRTAGCRPPFGFLPRFFGISRIDASMKSGYPEMQNGARVITPRAAPNQNRSRRSIMAASTHTTSRRALLAVLSAAPLLALPAMSTAPTGKWQALVARESAARNAFRGSKGLSEDAYDALVEAHNVALRAMLDCPAPTMAALAHKLATIGREDGWMMTDEDDAGVLPVLIADAQRLAASVH